jgi:predicted glutamine amidotransferase
VCGITAAFSTKANKKGQTNNKVNDIIISQFENQCSRGQKGFGIIRINKGKVEVDRACETTKFLMDLYLKPSSMIIAHHRTPTSTDNLLDQTHPMWVSNDCLENDYLVIHNGIISNDDDLRLKHIELGFKYQTEYTKISYQDKREQVWNDSEAIAIELALFIEKKISTISIDNAAAFMVLQIDKKTNKAKKVFFGKNGSYSDLNIFKAENELQISSEGIGEEVKENILFSFDIKDPLMTLKETQIPFKKPVAIVKVESPSPFDLPVANRTSDSKTDSIIKTASKLTERSWKDTYVSYSRDNNYLPPYAGKNYIEEQKTAYRIN